MLPNAIISVLMLRTAALVGQDCAARISDIAKKQLTKIAESKGQTIDWENQLVCIPNMPAGLCEDLTVWLKSTAAQTVKQIYLNAIMGKAFPQTYDWSCWVAAGLILRSFLNNLDKQTEDAFFQQHLKKILTTTNMINAANQNTGLFEGIQNAAQVARILNGYGPDKEVNYEDSLFIYKQILWRDDLTVYDDNHPQDIEWHKLRLCQFMFNTDSGNTGIPRPDEVSIEQRRKELRFVFFAVTWRFGYVTRDAPHSRVVIKGLQWPLATEWFDKILGLQTELIDNNQLTQQKLVDTLRTHGPFLVNPSLRITDLSMAVDPKKSHYIMIVDAHELTSGLYSFEYINTAIPVPKSKQYAVGLETIAGSDLTALICEVDDPRTLVYKK